MKVGVVPVAVQDEEIIRRRLTAKLREIRKFVRGIADEAPSQATICIWIELMHVLECYADVVALATHLYEAEADPWLYRRARRLVRLAEVKLRTQRDGA